MSPASPSSSASSSSSRSSIWIRECDLFECIIVSLIHAGHPQGRPHHPNSYKGTHPPLPDPHRPRIPPASLFLPTSPVSSPTAIRSIDFAAAFSGLPIATPHSVPVATPHNAPVAAGLRLPRPAGSPAVSGKHPADREEACLAVRPAVLGAGEVAVRGEDHRDQHLLRALLDGLQSERER